MYRNKKGFTLIEVLTTLVILGILALVIVPSVLKIINNSKNNAGLKSALGYLDAADLYYSEANQEQKEIAYNNMLEQLQVKGDKASSGYIKADKMGNISMSLIINDKCYFKDFNTNRKDIEIDSTLNKCK